MTYAYGRKSEDTKAAIRATDGRSDNDQMKKVQATIVLVVCVVFLCLVCPMLPVSLDCPFWIVSSVFSNVYLHKATKKTKDWAAQTSLKTEGERRCTERACSSCSIATAVVLLMLKSRWSHIRWKVVNRERIGWWLWNSALKCTTSLRIKCWITFTRISIRY